MMEKSLSLSGDLSRAWIAVSLLLAAMSLVLLAVEVRRRRSGGLAVASSGVLSTCLLALAILRPVSVLSRGSVVGPKVVVLSDRSRSMDLPEGPATRRDVLRATLERLKASAEHTRIRLLGFGDGAPEPWEPSKGQETLLSHSDLEAALLALASAKEERPQAIVVLSDGRLERPGSDVSEASLRALTDELGVPIHTVSLADQDLPDASIRAVRSAGAAVAHQAFPLTVEIGCGGGLSCGDLRVKVEQLVDRGDASLLASGTAHIEDGAAQVELSVTLDRTGPRILQVVLDTPAGDRVPDNNRRLFTLEVARDRVRVLHVAGRPTYDVRALRTWLKADASVDVVAFFILRTPTDTVNASDDDLALIPFPVHELFSEHLPTFDAVVLQDFNAEPYHLLQHLPSLATYVEKGGGLIMVGGPDSFSGGSYAGTRLAQVLPVSLAEAVEKQPFDLGSYVPRYTAAAMSAPMLRPLRGLLGDMLPEMSGCNLVGDARPGSIVLWTHPLLRTRSGAEMPLLALGEEGEGRSIALALDGSYRLSYSALASETAGRAHAALWDGLLGWLMRDPRYEPAQIELPEGCSAGEPLHLRILPLAGEGRLSIEVVKLGDGRTVAAGKGENAVRGDGLDVTLGRLEPGGYSARVRVGTGPSTRRDFACERGGDEWADTRPDRSRLSAIARASGGMFVRAADVDKLPLSGSTEIAAERNVSPWAPSWVWTLAAALSMGAHWILRRRSGFA